MSNRPTPPGRKTMHRTSQFNYTASANETTTTTSIGSSFSQPNWNANANWNVPLRTTWTNTTVTQNTTKQTPEMQQSVQPKVVAKENTLNSNVKQAIAAFSSASNANRSTNNTAKKPVVSKVQQAIAKFSQSSTESERKGVAQNQPLKLNVKKEQLNENKTANIGAPEVKDFDTTTKSQSLDTFIKSQSSDNTSNLDRLDCTVSSHQLEAAKHTSEEICQNSNSTHKQENKLQPSSPNPIVLETPAPTNVKAVIAKFGSKDVKEQVSTPEPPRKNRFTTVETPIHSTIFHDIQQAALDQPKINESKHAVITQPKDILHISPPTKVPISVQVESRQPVETAQPNELLNVDNCTSPVDPFDLLQPITKVPDVPHLKTCLYDDNAKAMHKSIMKIVKKVLQNKAKLEEFKINSKLFGNGFMDSTEYIASIVKDFGGLRAMQLIPCLILLQADHEKFVSLQAALVHYRVNNFAKLEQECQSLVNNNKEDPKNELHASSVAHVVESTTLAAINIHESQSFDPEPELEQDVDDSKHLEASASFVIDSCNDIDDIVVPTKHISKIQRTDSNSSTISVSHSNTNDHQQSASEKLMDDSASTEDKLEVNKQYTCEISNLTQNLDVLDNVPTVQNKNKETVDNPLTLFAVEKNGHDHNIFVNNAEIGKQQGPNNNTNNYDSEEDLDNVGPQNLFGEIIPPETSVAQKKQPEVNESCQTLESLSDIEKVAVQKQSTSSDMLFGLDYSDFESDDEES